MKILLAISGSIAAYKAPELLRQLQKRGCEVKVVRTESAAHFTTDLVLETLSGHPVMSSSLDLPISTEKSPGPIDHIALARWADLMLYAPASAAALSRLATGLAVDAPTVLATAFEKKIFIAPAMNQGMWKHPSVTQNLKTLRSYGYKIIEPDAGELACGEVGPGRLASVERITEAVLSEQSSAHPSAFQKEDASNGFDVFGKRVLISTGPTRAYIDPIRFISNPSSGKIGLELAKAFDFLGAQVTLVHGPLSLNVNDWAQKEELHIDFQTVPVETPGQMFTAVQKAFKQCDLFISAAAVSDFVPEHVSKHKIKKSSKNTFEISLKKSTDILAEINKTKKEGQLVFGFAAETEKLIENAQKKLRSKNLDGVFANEIKNGKGFGDQETKFTFVTHAKDPKVIGPGQKSELAPELCKAILEIWTTKLAERSRVATQPGRKEAKGRDGSLEKNL